MTPSNLPPGRRVRLLSIGYGGLDHGDEGRVLGHAPAPDEDLARVRFDRDGSVRDILPANLELVESDLPRPGERIRLIEMPNDPDPIPPGTTGTVVDVNEYPASIPASHSTWKNGRAVQTQLPAPDATAQVTVDWDIPRSLMLSLPVDRYEIIPHPVRDGVCLGCGSGVLDGEHLRDDLAPCFGGRPLKGTP